jgi:pimeloyl-ACP methyl ester carboxylesterase
MSPPVSGPLAHHRTGRGSPLVLLHALGADRHVWDPVVPLIAARREVIAVDLPGFGQSLPLAQR